MASERKRAEAPRTERVLPGVWRLRLALPWPGVPHGNVWAVAADGGVVLFDTGIGGKGRLRDFELALAQAGFGLEDVRLLVCTHSHTDHYGLAAPIVSAAGCELWMHPAWEHVRLLADDPAAALEQRIAVARESGVPAAALERYRQMRSDSETGIDAIAEPDRDLVAGVEVETDLGTWRVHETPGHAPSHVILHQPQRRLMISGDHLLGRTVLFFDYGHTPDPIGEFLGGLDEIEPLAVDLVLPGHGRTFREPATNIAEARRQVDELLGKVRASLAEGERTAFEVVADLIGPENLESPASAWALQIVRSSLDHLAIRGEAVQVEESEPRVWRLAG
ncbi:MAG TPA: MBL fold metallo-hydrolase [Solirubrobacterales bacterium]|nr:MBL fold metallo-hydrolase [Solirubrobacterales bacterium]